MTNKNGPTSATILCVLVVFSVAIPAKASDDGGVDLGQTVQSNLALFQVSYADPILHDLGIIADSKAMSSEEPLEPGSWHFKRSLALLGEHCRILDELADAGLELQVYTGNFAADSSGLYALLVLTLPRTLPEAGWSFLAAQKEDHWHLLEYVPSPIYPFRMGNVNLFWGYKYVSGTGVSYGNEFICRFNARYGHMTEILRYPSGEGYVVGWGPIDRWFEGESSIDTSPNAPPRVAINTTATYAVGDMPLFAREKQSVFEWDSHSRDLKRVNKGCMEKEELSGISDDSTEGILRHYQAEVFDLTRKDVTSRKILAEIVDRCDPDELGYLLRDRLRNALSSH